MRGICGPGRRHVCTVPGLDGVPRAMRGQKTLSIYAVPHLPRTQKSSHTAWDLSARHFIIPNETSAGRWGQLSVD